MEQEYIVTDVDEPYANMPQEPIYNATSNVEMNGQHLLEMIEPKIEPIDSENEDNAQIETVPELQKNSPSELPPMLRCSQQVQHNYVVYNVPTNNFDHPITTMPTPSTGTTQCSSMPRMSPIPRQLNTTPRSSQPALQFDIRPITSTAQMRTTTIPEVIMQAPISTTQKLPTLLLPTNGSATMPSYMKPIRFHKPLHFNLSNQPCASEKSVQYRLDEPMAKKPRLETQTAVKSMAPLKSLPTQLSPVPGQKTNQRREYSYFAEYIVCQLEQLPREVAVELEMQIHDLIGQKRLSLMRDEDKNCDNGSTIVIN